MKVKGKIALITGGETGMGKGMALRLAQEGTNICITNYSVSGKEAMATKAEIEALGVKCGVYKTDVSNDQQVRSLIDNVVKDFGSLDIMINCAGKTYFVKHEDLEGLTGEMWDDILNVNVKGLFFCQRAALPHIKKAGGIIINISSTSALTGTGSCIAYAASKAAIVNMTKAFARLAAPEGRVMCVSPGYVITRWVSGEEHKDRIEKFREQTPLKKVAYPNDIGNTVYGLIAYCDHMTGNNIVFDGGRFEVGV